MADVVRLDWQGIYNGFLELALLAAPVFYITLVLVSYFEDKTHARPRFDLRDPARSLERWVVWLGVAALVLALRLAAPIFAMLSEASAEVGEWFLNRRHPEAH
jgi:hypothetical protein